MSTFFASAAIVLLAFTGLAIGVIFKRGCIKGHCGGSVQADGSTGCTCGRIKARKEIH